jgi:hypothetical protein
MKPFKTYLLGLLIAVGALFASTTTSTAQRHVIELTPQWQQVGQKCFSCGSAFFLIHNEAVPRNGWYYSYVYVWSNSFDSRGTLTNTYITRPRIFMRTWQGEMKLSSSQYFLAYPQNNYTGFNGWNLMFTVWSRQPGSTYILKFDGLDDY